jgi:hypothetical protein
MPHCRRLQGLHIDIELPPSVSTAELQGIQQHSSRPAVTAAHHCTSTMLGHPSAFRLLGHCAKQGVLNASSSPCGAGVLPNANLHRCNMGCHACGAGWAGWHCMERVACSWHMCRWTCESAQAAWKEWNGMGSISQPIRPAACQFLQAVQIGPDMLHAVVPPTGS